MKSRGTGASGGAGASPTIFLAFIGGLPAAGDVQSSLMSRHAAADPDAIERTRESLGRCVACETFLQRFYELFTASSPRVAELFRNTDFERQKKMLRDSLYVMLVAAGTTKGPAHDEVERLARLHRDLGVTHDMFRLWLDALVEAAREHDVHFEEELEDDWRASLSAPIEIMKSGGSSNRA
jgi:truncated hemoglobin YjbI